MANILNISPVLQLSPGFLFYMFLILSGASIGIYKYRTLRNWVKLLTQMLVVVFIAGLSSKIILRYTNTNFPVFHILQIVQLIYFGFIFSSLFASSYPLKRLTLAVSVALTIVSITISIYFQSIWTFPSNGAILLGLFVTSASILLLLRMIQFPIEKPILQQPEFWFASGSMFFYAITFFILGFFKVIMVAHGAMPEWTYIIIHWTNYLLYFSYLMAIILSTAPPQVPSPAPKK